MCKSTVTFLPLQFGTIRVPFAKHYHNPKVIVQMTASTRLNLDFLE
jgi:hypothetical protein